MWNQLTSQSSSTSTAEQGVWLMANASVRTNYSLLMHAHFSHSWLRQGDTVVKLSLIWLMNLHHWLIAYHLWSLDLWEQKSPKWFILNKLSCNIQDWMVQKLCLLYVSDWANWLVNCHRLDGSSPAPVVCLPVPQIVTMLPGLFPENAK